jgi:hypothetical protein
MILFASTFNLWHAVENVVEFTNSAIREKSCNFCVQSSQLQAEAELRSLAIQAIKLHKSEMTKMASIWGACWITTIIS